MNNHELDNETNQAHNNSSQFMKQSLVNFHKLAMNRFKISQIHNNLSKFMNFNEQPWIR